MFVCNFGEWIEATSRATRKYDAFHNSNDRLIFLLIFPLTLEMELLKLFEKKYLFVITGGPGAGKTTLLTELERRGYPHLSEVARDIIREQVRTEGDAVPWANTRRYAGLMLDRTITAFLQLPVVNSPVFVDRGLPDVLCYAELIDFPALTQVADSCMSYRYNSKVFIAPPWEEIYTTDEERKQTFEEAVGVYHRLTRAYESCGYELVEIPRLTVEQRADFVLKAVASWASAKD